MMRVDAHHHFWDPARGDYSWMPQDDSTLCRVYGPADLEPSLRAHDIGCTILVQAAPTVAETDYMLMLADQADWVAGVVGWVDFEQQGQRAALGRLANHPKFKGVRPMIQDIADVDWMLRDGVQWGFAALCDLGLRLDALGLPRHLDNFHQLQTRHPDLPMVIDHCMKPCITVHTPPSFDHWARGMSRLADGGAWCKLSGLVTEADAGANARDLRPYVDHVFAAFGPDRVMWGSDWPVSRLRMEYGDWLRLAQDLTENLSKSHRDRVFGGTAVDFYNIPA